MWAWWVTFVKASISSLASSLSRDITLGALLLQYYMQTLALTLILTPTVIPRLTPPSAQSLSLILTFNKWFCISLAWLVMWPNQFLPITEFWNSSGLHFYSVSFGVFRNQRQKVGRPYTYTVFLLYYAVFWMKEKSAKSRVSREDRVTRGTPKKHLDMIYWQSYSAKRLVKYPIDHKWFLCVSISVNIRVLC